MQAGDPDGRRGPAEGTVGIRTLGPSPSLLFASWVDLRHVVSPLKALISSTRITNICLVLHSFKAISTCAVTLLTSEYSRSLSDQLSDPAQKVETLHVGL